jgi:hypothetical protein
MAETWELVEPFVRQHDMLLLQGADDRHAASLLDHKFPVLQRIAVRLFHRLGRRRTQHYRIDDIHAAGAPI